MSLCPTRRRGSPLVALLHTRSLTVLDTSVTHAPSLSMTRHHHRNVASALTLRPSPQARLTLLKLHLGSTPHSLSEQQLRALSRRRQPLPAKAPSANELTH